jgi:hypothetical protein
MADQSVAADGGGGLTEGAVMDEIACLEAEEVGRRVPTAPSPMRRNWGRASTSASISLQRGSIGPAMRRVHETRGAVRCTVQRP